VAPLLLASVPAFAQDDGQVFVLGIRSVEGDDELSRNLTGAIRQEARGVDDWSVAEAEISLAQMSVAHGCDEPDAQCMAEIAEELAASRIVYGTVRRTGAGEQYDYALTLYNFNAQTGQIEDSLTDTIPSVQADIDNLRPRAERYIAQFAGQARYGSVRIQTQTPGATVFIDEENAGTTDEGGALVVTDVTEGDRDVRIEAVDFEVYEGNVRVVPDEQTELRATLVRQQATNLGWIPGAAVIAAGVVFGALGMKFGLDAQGQRDQRSSLLALDDANRNCVRDALPAGRITSVERSRALMECSVAATSLGELTPLQVGLLRANDTSSICADPDPNIDGLEDACNDRTKFRVLQYVFYGLGLAAVAGGTVLLINGLGGDEEEGQARGPSLDIQPYFSGRRDMGVSATLQF
jgi:hypothetical protein